MTYKPRVAFAASTGGHLVELRQLKELVGQYESYPVTEFDESTRDVAAYFLVRDYNNNLFKKIFVQLSNCRRSIKIIKEIRPDFVISTGAFSAALFCKLAQKFGAKIIYIETAAKYQTGSKAGKFAYKFADLFIIQKKSLQKVYPNGIYLGSIFKLKVSKTDHSGKHILALLGTQHNPFPRLLEAVEKLNVKEKIIVQAGHTKFDNPKIETHAIVPQTKYDEWTKDAKIIIAHAGVGSIMNSLAAAKPTIVVPRLSNLGEHGDDHQQAIVKEFADKGYIILAKNLSKLSELVKKARKFSIPKIDLDNSKMIKAVGKFIDEN
jgi:UDP-N-acetylglucosamine transferase subunit ALG13